MTEFAYTESKGFGRKGGGGVWSLNVFGMNTMNPFFRRNWVRQQSSAPQRYLQIYGYLMVSKHCTIDYIFTFVGYIGQSMLYVMLRTISLQISLYIYSRL